MTLQQMVNDSYLNLKKILKEAKQNRQQHLTDLAEKYTWQHNISQNTAITELLSYEKSRHIFSELKRKLKPLQCGQLKPLWISMDEHGNYSKDPESKTLLSDVKQIHQALLQRNSTHVTQASSTLFARGELQRGLTWDGTGKLSNEILSGKILQETRFSGVMQLYLESLQSNS